jgi:hypothetical protein
LREFSELPNDKSKTQTRNYTFARFGTSPFGHYRQGIKQPYTCPLVFDIIIVTPKLKYATPHFLAKLD